MGMLDELKLKYTCMKDGRMQEYETYKEHKKAIQSNINMYSRYVKDATQKFTNIAQSFPENSTEYINARDQINRWQQRVDNYQLSLKFVRPNSQEDEDYRKAQCESFVSNLQSVISPKLDLRFHGTPIYFAEQIIKSGKISSTADRYDGYIKSTDGKGEISASSVKTLGRTIDFFSDMVAYQRCLPAGCIFAVFPKDNEDATYGTDLLHSVDFRQNPEQLFGVFTTPENIGKVKEWMNSSGFNPDSVYTFEGFIQVVKERSDIIEEQARSENIVKEAEINDNLKNNLKIESSFINMDRLTRNALEQRIISSEISEVDNMSINEQQTKDDKGVSLDEQ